MPDNRIRLLIFLILGAFIFLTYLANFSGMEPQTRIVPISSTNRLQCILKNHSEILPPNPSNIRCHKNKGSRQVQPCLTIVTSYFTFGKTKHSIAEYLQWAQNFLQQTQTPMVIFTQPSLKAELEIFRKGKPTYFIIYEEIWDLPWLNDPTFLYKEYHHQHSLDPEGESHSPELYAVWNSKPWMMRTAAELNPFNSSYFFWMDIGSVRDKRANLKKFPSLDRAIEVFGEDERCENYHKLNLFTIKRFDKYKPPPDSNTYQEMNMDFVVGTFFGGTIFSLTWFSETFYNLHDKYIANKTIFIGKDQTLYNWIAVQHPEKIVVVSSALEKQAWIWEKCDNAWTYFQTWYGAEDEGSSSCRSAPAKNMEDFLTENRNIWQY